MRYTLNNLLLVWWVTTIRVEAASNRLQPPYSHNLQLFALHIYTIQDILQPSLHYCHYATTRFALLTLSANLTGTTNII